MVGGLRGCGFLDGASALDSIPDGAGDSITVWGRVIFVLLLENDYRVSDLSGRLSVFGRFELSGELEVLYNPNWLNILTGDRCLVSAWLESVWLQGLSSFNSREKLCDC